MWTAGPWNREDGGRQRSPVESRPAGVGRGEGERTLTDPEGVPAGLEEPKTEVSVGDQPP